MKRYTLNEDDLHEALRRAFLGPFRSNERIDTTELKWSVVGGRLTVSLFEIESPKPDDKLAEPKKADA